MKRVLIATVKPFASQAVEEIKKIFKDANYDLVLLEKYKDKKEFIDAVKDVDALIVRSDKVDKEIIDNAKSLKIIVRAGAGYDNIDIAYAKEKNIVVMNTPGQNANAVAELVFGMMIYIARNKFSGKSGRELMGKTLGIHAFGNVGRYVAKIAKGFQMKVYAYDPFIDQNYIKDNGAEPLENVEDLYKKSDYVSLHLPKLPSTIGSINYQLLSLMKDGATLVNTARKEVVNEDDLKRMFSERKDFKYVSDIAPDCKDELLEKYADRCYFTPKKMGAQTLEANINAGCAAANQIVNFFEKGDITYQVNK